jgi:hypothetical protein
MTTRQIASSLSRSRQHARFARTVMPRVGEGRGEGSGQPPLRPNPLAVASRFRTHTSPIRARQRPAYVLIAVLGLLVLSATLLVAVSRTATRSALAARSADEDLQRRWGVATCRKAVLPYAEQMLTALEQGRRRPTAKLETSIRLGAMNFDLIVADEQAKANVNTILQAADLTSAESRIRGALAGSGLANNVKLRPTLGPVVFPLEPTTAPTSQPTTQPQQPQRPAPTIGAFAQILSDVPPSRLIRPAAASRLAVADLLTCWSSGEINARRATAQALQLAAGRSVSGTEIGRLVDARDALWQRPGLLNDPQTAAEQFKEQIGRTVGESAKNNGNLALTQTSRCQSLWIISRSPRRDWYDLAIIERTNDTQPQITTFSW